MAISIVDWMEEISNAKVDEEVGIRVATLSEIGTNGTYYYRDSCWKVCQSALS
jgi:hypothetical protein